MSHRWIISISVALLLVFTAATGAERTSAQDASTTLASNMGQATSATEHWFERDQAQAFTTGSTIGGFTITSISLDVAIDDGARQPTYGVHIYSADSSGKPTGSSLAQFTGPNALVTGVNTFRGNLELDANASYAVVLDVTGSFGSTVRIRWTDSTSEDSGSWAIADEGKTQVWNQTGWNAGTGATKAMKIRVEGRLAPAPALVALQEYFETGSLDSIKTVIANYEQDSEGREALIAGLNQQSSSRIFRLLADFHDERVPIPIGLLTDVDNNSIASRYGQVGQHVSNTGCSEPRLYATYEQLMAGQDYFCNTSTREWTLFQRPVMPPVSEWGNPVQITDKHCFYEHPTYRNTLSLIRGFGNCPAAPPSTP